MRMSDQARPVPTWRGFLTSEALPAVAALFQSVLHGRTFSRVFAYEYKGWSPEVCTGLTSTSVAVSGDTITVSDSDGVWGPSVSTDGADPVAISICPEEIRYRAVAPSGLRYWVVITIEGEPADLGDQPAVEEEPDPSDPRQIAVSLMLDAARDLADRRDTLRLLLADLAISLDEDGLERFAEEIGELAETADITIGWSEQDGGETTAC